MQLAPPLHPLPQAFGRAVREHDKAVLVTLAAADAQLPAFQVDLLH
jgi:hypothetical protein